MRDFCSKFYNSWNILIEVLTLEDWLVVYRNCCFPSNLRLCTTLETKNNLLLNNPLHPFKTISFSLFLLANRRSVFNNERINFIDAVVSMGLSVSEKAVFVPFSTDFVFHPIPQFTVKVQVQLFFLERANHGVLQHFLSLYLVEEYPTLVNFLIPNVRWFCEFYGQRRNILDLLG
jgi:hypothetical protein